MRVLFISNKERSEVNQGFSERYITVLHATLQIYFTVKHLVILKKEEKKKKTIFLWERV